MVRRHEGTAFMGGAHVFPGGRVDAADHDGADAWCDGIAHAASAARRPAAAEAVAYHVAAARELFEEAGVLLARDAAGAIRFARGRRRCTSGSSGSHRRPRRHTTRCAAIVERERLRLALDALVLFAHWVTPPIDTRQFDTRFFMTRVPPRSNAGARRHRNDAQRVDDAGRRDRAVASRRNRAAAADVDHAARARAVRRRWTTRWRGRGGRTHRPPSARAASSTTAFACSLMPGDPLHPDPGGDDAPAETRFVSVDGGWRAERPPT